MSSLARNDRLMMALPQWLDLWSTDCKCSTRIKKESIRNELLHMYKNECFFDHPKIYFIVVNILDHCDRCIVCNICDVCFVPSKPEYNRDSDICSVVLFMKTLIKTMQRANACMCPEIDVMVFIRRPCLL